MSVTSAKLIVDYHSLLLITTIFTAHNSRVIEIKKRIINAITNKNPVYFV